MELVIKMKEMEERTHKTLPFQRVGVFQLPGYFTLQREKDL